MDAGAPGLQPAGHLARRWGPTFHSRLMRSLLLALLAVVLLAAPARAQLHVVVRTSPVADFVHGLDCITAVISACGKADYDSLWFTRILRTRQDTLAARDWQRLRRRYDAGVDVDTSSADLVGRGTRRVSLAESWRLAGLQARSWDDYDERLALVLLPRDRARVQAAVQQLRPTFEAWWEAEARARLARGRDSIDAMLATPAMAGLLGRMRDFYGATGPASDTLVLTLVARPGLKGRGSSAEAVNAWAVQELVPGARLTGEVGVTLHEVGHLLLSLGSDSARAAVAREFGRGGVEGRAARALLDEGLATAFGNGLVERALGPADGWAPYLERPLSFYNDPVVDAAGKALWRTLDSLLAAGARLEQPATVAAIRGALAAGMGPRLTSPRALLHDVLGFVDHEVADPFVVARAVAQGLQAGNFSFTVDSAGAMPREPLLRDPWVGTIVVAPPRALARLAARGAFRAGEVAAMRRAAAGGPVLWGARRDNGARTWVVVARSAAEAVPLVERLVALERDMDGAVPGGLASR